LYPPATPDSRLTFRSELRDIGIFSLCKVVSRWMLLFIDIIIVIRLVAV
jgi:hypothetical protein